MSLDLGIKILPPMRPIWTFSGLSIHIIKQTICADLCYVLSRSMYLFHVLFCALLQIQILRCLQHGSQFRLKWLYQSFHGGQTPIPSLFSESDGKVQTTNLINYWTNAIASPIQDDQSLDRLPLLLYFTFTFFWKQCFIS